MAPAAQDAAKLNLRSKTTYFSSINTFNQLTEIHKPHHANSDKFNELTHPPPIKYKISIKYNKIITKFKTIKL